MTRRPTVTVLMAVHDEARSVEAALASVLQQSYADWECLVVDDASSDETPQLLDAAAAADGRIRVLRLRTNVGLAASLNAGLREAKGELIARLDADDSCTPGRLREQVSFLSEHPEIAVLGTGAELVGEAGERLGVALRPEHHEALVARIFRENPFIHPSVVVRRAFFEALGGYDPRLRRAQDYDLWLRGYRIARYHNLQMPLIRYRVRRKPRFDSLLYGSWMLLRATRREGRLVAKGWYAARYLLAGLATHAGLWSSRTR